MTVNDGKSGIVSALHDRGALGVFLVALALRLTWAIYVQVSHPGETWYVQGDAFEYTTVVENLLSGRGWWSPDLRGMPYFHGPIFPLFLAGMRSLGIGLFGVTVAHAFIGALTCWAVVRIGRRMMAPAGALCAGYAMAVYPYFLHYTTRILTETLSVFFGMLLIATFLSFSRNPGYVSAAIAGLVLGLATLNHPETYLAPPLLLLWVLAFHPSRARAVKGLCVLLAVFGLTILPWHAYHALKNGKNILLPPSLGADGLMAQSTLEAKGRIEGDPDYYRIDSQRLAGEGAALEEKHGTVGGLAAAARRVLDDVISQPGEYLRFVWLKLKRMWNLAPEKGVYDRPLIVIPTGVMSGLLYGGFLIGVILYRPREEAALVLVFIAIYTIPHLIFYAQPRYRLPVMPMVALMAGYTAGLVFERLAGSSPSPSFLRNGDRRESV